MTSRLFKHIFVLVIIIWFLNFLGNLLHLHWTVWWFDMVLHFLGGAMISMMTLWFLYYYLFKSLTLDRKILILSILSVVIVGTLWEVFELYFNITFLSDGMTYILDTTSDIILDITGGIVGYIYSSRIIRSNRI